MSITLLNIGNGTMSSYVVFGPDLVRTRGVEALGAVEGETKAEVRPYSFKYFNSLRRVR